MVIILDKHKKPLGFTTEKRVRKLLDAGRACIFRYFPMVVIIKDRDIREMSPESIGSFRIKIDPGSIHTGIAIVGNEDNRVYFYMKLEHRAGNVKEDLLTRRQARRNRRSRETLYRKAKWDNLPKGDEGHLEYDSGRKKGWLVPSVKSIADNIIALVRKLRKYIPITECSFEAVRFDTQLMDNPEIEGKEYQHGTLMGYEMKEYLMEHYQHTCQYCGGASGDPVLEWEHMRPVSRGGSDSVKNATLACRKCNREKGSRKPKEWLEALMAQKHPTDLDQQRIECIPKAVKGTIVGKSSRYCAWVTAMRRYTERALFGIFGEVECSSGGRTKYNREKLKLPKDHHYDALCVGTVPENGFCDLTNGYCLCVTAKGRGTRLRGQINGCGIIRVKYRNNQKRFHRFQTGDIVALDKPSGKNAGYYKGRVMVRASGYFDVGKGRNVVNASHRYYRILQRSDGYDYEYKIPIPLGN